METTCRLPNLCNIVLSRECVYQIIIINMISLKFSRDSLCKCVERKGKRGHVYLHVCRKTGHLLENNNGYKIFMHFWLGPCLYERITSFTDSDRLKITVLNKRNIVTSTGITKNVATIAAVVSST